MFKLSPLFVVLLATLSYASPAVVETRGGPPERANVCEPVGIDKTIRYFLQSNSIPTKVWQVEGVTADTFDFVDLQTKTTATSGQALNNQLWSVQPVNSGNSFAFISAGPTATVCAVGDGGPLNKVACDGVFNTSMVVQPAQFFISCITCDAKGKGATNCQIQSAFEGQCALFFDETDNAIIIGDCLDQPNQFWDIVPEA